MARPKKVVENQEDEVKEAVMEENNVDVVEEQEIELKPVKRLVCPSDKTHKFQLVTYGKPVLVEDPEQPGELVVVDSEIEDGYVCVTCHHLYELDDLEAQAIPDFGA